MQSKVCYTAELMNIGALLIARPAPPVKKPNNIILIIYPGINGMADYERI